VRVPGAQEAVDGALYLAQLARLRELHDHALLGRVEVFVGGGSCMVGPSGAQPSGVGGGGDGGWRGVAGQLSVKRQAVATCVPRASESKSTTTSPRSDSQWCINS
jgi:hypothetical protein